MSRLVFIGIPKDYGYIYSKGKTYESNYKPESISDSVGESAISYPNDWIEIDQPKPLHKDTDLGHFAGLAMQGYLANPNPDVVRMDQEEIAEYCINHAKELIKQLNEASPNNLPTH